MSDGCYGIIHPDVCTPPQSSLHPLPYTHTPTPSHIRDVRWLLLHPYTPFPTPTHPHHRTYEMSDGCYCIPTLASLHPHTHTLTHKRCQPQPQPPSHINDVRWLLWHLEVSEHFPGMPHTTPRCPTFAEAVAVNWLAGPDCVYAMYFSN